MLINKKESLIWRNIPDFAKDYPDIAQTLEEARLNFYCINCYRKKVTTYITSNFGPLCYECLEELENKG